MPYRASQNQVVLQDLSEVDEDILFIEWQKNQNHAAGNALVRKYMPLVQMIVEKMARTVPRSVEKDELRSLALTGLYEALTKYDPKRNLKFTTYASFRIRGAILDGLRKEDWLPRKTREKVRKLEQTIAAMEQKFMRSPTPDEIARAAGIPVEEVQSLLDEVYFSNILSIDDNKQDDDEQEGKGYTLRDDSVKGPEEEIVFSETVQELAENIKQLNEKEQLVLSLIYQEELTLTEIGQIMDLSTSRISQIHSKAVKKLRAMMNE